MNRVAFRLVVAGLAFLLGIIAATWFSVDHFGGNSPKQVGVEPVRTGSTPAGVLPGWSEVGVEGRVYFHVPPDLRPEILDTLSNYKAFQNDAMEVMVFFGRGGATAVCVDHSQEKLSKLTALNNRVGNKDATILYIDEAIFGNQDLSSYEPSKGITICVPKAGDGHEFALAARYKNERGRQDLLRIIDSIRFR